MSIASEITRIKANISNAYTACGSKGATLPQTRNSANLAATINAISAGVEAEALSWVQTSEAVRNYLANVTYDPSDYTTSQIANYAPSTAATANHTPAGKTISVSVGRLDRSGYVQTVATGNVTVYNDIPNAKTPFTVDNNGAVSKTGTLNPTHFLRQIKCTAAVNVRDLGGWACDGGHVKYGKLIRGGEPAASDIDVLVNQCGVRYELNLRGRSEANREYSVLGSDIGYSVFDNYVWYSIADKALWCDMLRILFDCIAENKPVYFHCAAGADRTGTFACIVEAILGMSQSDIDKDYELTCFAMGTGTDAAARRRNETDWIGLITEINAKSGNTFRDKVVSFVLELGFTIDEINAFRAAMINGTPEVLTANLNTYTVTNILTNVSNNNSAQSVTQYQGYEAVITPANGKIINAVTVTMGGVDITRQVFNGAKDNLLREITYNLSNCSAISARKNVIDGQMFYAEVEADTGYTLDGATVTITMGGVNVNNYYSEGRISIPNVTGNISITVTAVETAAENLFDLSAATDHARIKSDGTVVAYGTGNLVTGFIEASVGDTVFYSSDVSKDNDAVFGTMAFYQSDGSFITSISRGNTGTNAWHWATDGKSGYITIPSSFNSKDLTTAAKVKICIPYSNTDNIIVNRLSTPPTLT